MKKPEILPVSEGSEGSNRLVGSEIDPLTRSLVDIVAGGGSVGVAPPPDLPVPPAKPVSPKPTVWMACRSQRPCGGNQATLELVSNLAAGGRVSRYRCNKCGKKFGVYY